MGDPLIGGSASSRRDYAECTINEAQFYPVTRLGDPCDAGEHLYNKNKLIPSGPTSPQS